MELALAANDDIFIVHIIKCRPIEDLRIYKEIESPNHLSLHNLFQIS